MSAQPAVRVSLIRVLARKSFVLAAVLPLAGCGSTVVRTERVEVPVPVPCVVPVIERPAWAMDALPVDAGLYETVRAALVEIEQRRAYEARLEAAVAGCG